VRNITEKWLLAARGIRGTLYRNDWKLAVLLAAAILASAAFLLWPRQADPISVPAAISAADLETAQDRTVIVYVNGAVKNPGLYTLSAGLRVVDAIVSAGGLTPEADATCLPNLAAHLKDAKQILVPFTGHCGKTTKKVKLDVNTATRDQLLSVPGMDPPTRRRHHQLPRGERWLPGADRAEELHGHRRHALQTAREVADRAVSGLPWWTFALLLVGFSAGVMALVLLSPVMPLVAAVVLVGVLIAVVRPRLWPIVLLTLLAMALGVARAAVAPTVALPAGLGTDDVSVSGTVDDDPQTRRSGTRLTIRIDHIQVPGLGQVSTLRVQATVYGGVPVHYGDLVLLRGRLQPPPAFDQFDYRAYLAEQGIAGVMPSARLIRDTPHPGDPLHDRALRRPPWAGALG